MRKFSFKYLFVGTYIIYLMLCFTAYADDYTESTVTFNTSYETVISENLGNLSIKGSSQLITLTLPETITLENNLRIDNITLVGECTIYANGYTLYIGENVKSENRLSVYGGSNGISVESTDLYLYGGLYKTVYAGGRNAPVTGNTKLVFGSNSNIGDGISDSDSATVSPCYIYGGGNNGAVLGSTNITLEGNAVAKYIFGAGTGANGTVTESNIYINGGKVMNVYGGASTTYLSDCNTHITMAGGIAEAIFGGSSQNSMTGNTYVTLLGGEVTRRVYSGCYNDWNIIFTSSYHVNGTTTLVLGSDIKLNTKNGLSADNSQNVGVFAGSRLGKNGNPNEINTIIYLDGCYDTQSEKIGEKSDASLFFYSNESYSIKCSKGGTVFSDSIPGNLYIKYDFGKYVTVNGNIFKGNSITVSKGTTQIDFCDDFSIKSLDIKNNGSVKTVNVEIAAENVFNRISPSLFIAVYDEKNQMKSVCKYDIDTKSLSFTIDFPQTDITYAKAFIAEIYLNPLCKEAKAEL